MRQDHPVRLRLAPSIFITSVLTHLCGGSAGREGAALQLGGAISGNIGHLMHLDDKDSRTITMCGMAACFSALFGTPLAASVFAMEVISVGVMYYAALFPSILASVDRASGTLAAWRRHDCVYALRCAGKYGCAAHCKAGGVRRGLRRTECASVCVIFHQNRSSVQAFSCRTSTPALRLAARSWCSSACCSAPETTTVQACRSLNRAIAGRCGLRGVFPQSWC